jgi:hypothetical protein
MTALINHGSEYSSTTISFYAAAPEAIICPVFVMHGRFKNPPIAH